MAKIKLLIFIIFIFSACQSVSKKIDDKTIQEEKELSKWLNQPESELKIVYGQPHRVEFLENRNKYYFYVSKKFKIKCERKFEINPKNIVIGFSSKNCF
jgi:Mg2+ and Co2+ transporter CorA